MRVRRVALKGRRLDAIDRQRDDQDRLAAKRIAIGAKDRAAIALDERCHPIGSASACARLRG